MLRMTTLPLFDGLWTATAACYVGLGVLYPTRARALTIVGLGAAAALHGLHNFVSDDARERAVLAASVLLFVCVTGSAEELSLSLGERFGQGPVPGRPEDGAPRAVPPGN